ncbi:MAG: hypothetical protein SF339_07010 [Blastocatellia bacterium]|nr:hypothetical protein [Blastocatellia bacterium]
MNTQEMTLEQIRTIGLEALVQALGPTGLIRFLQMFEQGRGDYTREREHILPTLSVTEIAEAIRLRRSI